MVSTSARKCILYFHTKPTTFVRRDIEMLSEQFEVRHHGFYHRSKFFTPILFFKQIIFLLGNIKSCSVVFCMFAGYHSFLPALFCKLFKKPFVIILGGTDSVVIPSLQYGILRKGLIGAFARWSYAMTSHFAPVHDSLIFYKNTYDESLPAHQGLKYHVPEAGAEFTVIHNGFDEDKFRNLNRPRISNSFLTVAFDLHRPNLFQLKGADLIVGLASYFPDCTFTIVGLRELRNCPKNVFPKPSVDHNELLELYNSHEFYFQLSITEGFPNALCEAMLCGCIPIVSNISSMPEIINGKGFILEKREINLLKKLIEGPVLNCEKKHLSQQSRLRIINQYPLEKRKVEFNNLIDQLSSST